MSTTNRTWRYLLVGAAGACAAALLAARRRNDPGRMADDVLLAQLAREMAAAAALADTIAGHAASDELRAAAQRWLDALARGGSWHPFLAAQAPDEPRQFLLHAQDDEAFDARAAQAMQEWLELAREHLQALRVSSRRLLRRRAAAAIATVDASACDLDFYQRADELLAAMPASRRWPPAPFRADARAALHWPGSGT
ncbi:hypothetical protein [Stenotrophomonas acidaminiphila]